VCDQLLAQAPADLGLEVLVDMHSLEPGQPWPSQLHEMMGYCQAGILLLTKNSINSPWVLKEATILTWRKAVEKKFELFVVQDSDIVPIDLQVAKFDPLMLGDIQRVIAQKPIDIAKQVVSRLNTIANRTFDTPYETIVGLLSILIKQIDNDILKKIRVRLQLKVPPWRYAQDDTAPDAALIARHLLRGEIGTYSELAQFVADLAPQVTPVQTVRNIFQLVAPYWVPIEDAGRLPALWGEVPQDRVPIAVMIGKHIGNYSADMYIRRAHLGSVLVDVISVPANNPGELSDHVRTEICKWFKETEEVEDDEAIVLAKQVTDRFVYVIVSGLNDLPPDDAMLGILKEFANMRFIFDFKLDNITTKVVDKSFDKYELDQDLEDRQWRTCMNVKRSLKRAEKGI